MERVYKFDQLPEGFSALAHAAWLALNDRELYEVNGRLIFTDNIDVVLGKSNTVAMIHEFANHAAFEKWLLECVAEWCIAPDDVMLKVIEERIRVG